MGYRLGLVFCLAIFLGACSKGTESVQVFEPRLEGQERKSLFCSPEKISFSFLDSQKKFIHTSQFQSFFDCANYDNKYQGLYPLFHSKATPDFLESLMNSVNSISTAESTKNIKATLEPWFKEYKDTGESKIDHILPVVAKVIKNAIFRKGLPLLAAVMDQGKPVWNTMLTSFSRLVYDPFYPDLYRDFRRLFNIRTLSKKIDHLAITTREFFVFLRKENPDVEGKKKTNASLLLELLDDMNSFTVPNTGMLSLIEYANNRDIFGTLYQEAGGTIRGEEVLIDLYGDKVSLTNDDVKKMQRQRLDKLFSGSPAPIYQLISLVDVFNKPRPQFLPSVAQWFGKKPNQERLHTDMVNFVARRMVGEILNSLKITEYFNDFLTNELKNQVPLFPPDPTMGTAIGEIAFCKKKLNCEVTGKQFAYFVRLAFSQENFVTWITDFLDKANIEKFNARNAELLRLHGGLNRTVLDLFRNTALIDFAVKLVGASATNKNANKNTVPKMTLRAALNSFSKILLQESSKFKANQLAVKFAYGANAQDKYFYDLMVDAWLNSAHEAWGESVIMQEAFRVVHLYLAEAVKSFAEEKITLSQWFFRSTYADPSFIERLIYEARRSGILSRLEINMRWLKDEIGPEIFKDPDDLAAFRMAVDQMPNFITYIEAGLGRSGNNVTRALSERDDGYLIKSYVNIISQAYEKGWVKKFLPLWLDFIHFMDVREQRINQAIAEAQEKMDDKEKGLEKLREARRQSDGVDAMKRFMRGLFRPRIEDDWSTSLAGEILVPLRELASKRRAEMEDFLLAVADKAIEAKDDEIDSVYDFISPASEMSENATDAEVREDQNFRKDMAELLRYSEFPTVFIELDRLFKDEAVLPALDFLAQKIDDGKLRDLLQLIRKLLGIQEVR